MDHVPSHRTGSDASSPQSGQEVDVSGKEKYSTKLMDVKDKIIKSVMLK